MRPRRWRDQSDLGGEDRPPRGFLRLETVLTPGGQSRVECSDEQRRMSWFAAARTTACARGCAKVREAVRTAEQRREVRRVHQQDVARALVPAGGIHSNTLISLLPAAVNGCGRSRSIGLAAKHADRARVRRRHSVVREMRVEVERRHRSATRARRDRDSLVSGAMSRVPGDHRGAEAEFVPHGYVQRLHQRACVLAEALLARDERIAMMPYST